MHRALFNPGEQVGEREPDRVQPGLIRVEADELTYSLHVILRFELEQALMSGALKADDVPAAWSDTLHGLLGVRPSGDDRGCLQDVHWPEALFGYFPCYSLGAMYAAQWFATMRRGQSDLDACIARGELTPVFDWLRENIWLQASRWDTNELSRRASGELLNPAHFRAHLESRYL